MSLKDLPSPNAPNFPLRVREMLHTMLGKTGSADERLLTLREAVASGVVKPGPGGALVPGDAIDGTGGEAYVPDLTPPPQPDTLTATPAISHILLEVPAATYTQGHGHLRTRVYGATRLSGDPAPVFADAVEVGQFSGTVWAFPSNPSTTWHFWAKWESVDGVLSATPVGGANGVVATTGQDVSRLVLAMTGTGNPFKVVTSETTLPDGSVVPPGTYTSDAYIHNGQINNAKIANLAVDDAKVANLSVSKLTAGSLAVGQYAESTGYVAGSSGWRINGDGNAELSGVLVRGAIFASQGTVGGWTIGSNYLQSNTYVLGTSGTRFNSDGTGQIGGITIYSQGLGAGSTAYDTGNGAWIGRDGRLSLRNSAGTQYLRWDGSALQISGALQAATGTFAGSLSAATGTFSGALSAATGTFSGSLTADAVNAVNTINLAGNAVTIPASAYTAAAVNTTSSNMVVQTVTVTSPGGVPFFIFGRVDGNAGYLRLFAESSQLVESQNNNLSYVHTPSAGTTTYTLRTQQISGGSTYTVSNRTLLVLGTKR